MFSFAPPNFGSRTVVLCLVQGVLLLGLYSLRLLTTWQATAYLLLLCCLSLWLLVAASVAFSRERTWLALMAALLGMPGLLYLLATLVAVLN